MGKRIFTLLVGILIFVVVFGLDSLGLIHGAIFYNIAMAICSFLMCDEFYKAMEEKGYKPLKIIGYICVLFLIPIGVVKTYTMMMICAIGVPIVLFIGMLVTVGSRLKYNVVDVAITIFSVIYIVFLVAFLSTIRALPMGAFLVFYPICGAWFSDTTAFLVGKAIGKHKFSKISPKKTIEGCIGGLIGTLLFFVIYSLCLNNMTVEQFEKSAESMTNTAYVENVESGEIVLDELEYDIVELEQRADYTMQQKLKEHFYTNYPLLIILGLIVSVISQIGDLAASAIKRYADIKDFSNLMPGHGGMLDRFDSILFLAPIMYYTFFIIARL